MRNLWVLVAGLFCLAILDFFCIQTRSPEIERDLLARSTIVLRENGIPAGGLSFDGRDALLKGVKGSPEVSDFTRRLVEGVIGVRIVETEFIAGTLPPNQDPVPAKLDPVQAKVDEALKGRKIEFAAESAVLTPAGKAALDSIVPILQASPDVSIEIRGTADRAAAVKTYFVSKGLPPGRLNVTAVPGSQSIQFVAVGGK